MHDNEHYSPKLSAKSQTKSCNAPTSQGMCDPDNGTLPYTSILQFVQKFGASILDGGTIN